MDCSTCFRTALPEQTISKYISKQLVMICPRHFPHDSAMGRSWKLVEAAAPMGSELSAATRFMVHILPQLFRLVAVDVGVGTNHIAISQRSLNALRVNLITDVFG